MRGEPSISKLFSSTCLITNALSSTSLVFNFGNTLIGCLGDRGIVPSESDRISEESIFNVIKVGVVIES